jgi:protein tyrosine phosphatase
MLSKSETRNWLHQSLTGPQAEKLLEKEGKVGSFLVRTSGQDPSAYRLSVRLTDSVTHVRINNDGDGFNLLGPGEDTFPSLTALVRHYSEGGPGYGQLNEKNGSPIELRFPLPKCDHITERFFHRDISGPEAESLLEPLKAGWFLVRRSKTQPGNFVLSTKTADDQLRILHVFITVQNGQYSIGDGKKFNSLAQLVNYYRSNEMQDKSGVRLTLKQAVDKTEFRVSDIALRVGQLEKVFEINGDMRDGFWEEFAHIENQEDTYSHSFDSGKLPENKKKNRYKNILPYEETRVKLKLVSTKVVGSDYINANHIRISRSGGHRHYIAAQGCMQTTIADFWLMVWQENSCVIGMLTALNENGKTKCAKYWPDETEGPQRHDVHNGRLIVEPVSTNANGPDWILRTFRVRKESSKGKPDGPARTVYQYHYLNWPDKKVPSSADASTVLQFMEQINGRWIAAGMTTGPLVVHCSAGIGRTGTYIAIDLLITDIKEKGKKCTIDVAQTINTLRQHRPGLVQVWHQYRFIYIAIKNYCENDTNDDDTRQQQQPQHSLELYENIAVSRTRSNPPSVRQKVSSTTSLTPGAVSRTSVLPVPPPASAKPGQSQNSVYENIPGRQHTTKR